MRLRGFGCGLTGSTVFKCVEPLAGVGDISPPLLRRITEKLYLLPGDVALSSFEDILSVEWPKALGDSNLYRPMRILSAFWQIMDAGASDVEADVVLVDIGPNLGAINRSALLAADFVAIPLGADLFSLQGLSNLGPSLRSWRSSWRKRLENWEESTENRSVSELQLPSGKMKPIGYLCQQHGVRLDRPGGRLVR